MQLLDTMLCMAPWRGCNKSVRCKIIYSFTGSFEVVRHLLKLLRTPDAYIARSSWCGCNGNDESGGVAWRFAAGSTAEMVDAPELTLTACKLQSMPSCGLLPPHLQHGRVGQGEGELEIKAIMYDECWRKASRPRRVTRTSTSRRRCVR